MSLSSEEKGLIADTIAAFAMKIIVHSVAPNETVLHKDLDDFHSFVCGALEAAIRDGRREALTTALN